MGTTGFKQPQTKSQRSRAWLGATLVLGLLAMSCSGGSGRGADMTGAVPSEAPAVELSDDTGSLHSDVGEDRDSSGSVDLGPAAADESRTRTDEAQPEPESEPAPMAEEEPIADRGRADS